MGASTSQIALSREQLAHLALDRLTSPVVVLSSNRSIAFWNQAAEHVFGYPTNEAEGRSLETLVFPARGNGQETALTEAAGNGSASFAAECRTKTGRSVLLEVAVDAVSDHGGTQPEWYVLTFRPSQVLRAGVAPQPGAARQPLEGLTARQREVLELIAEGWSTRHIAQKLKLSVKTVETHRAHLMQRLRVDSVAKLVRYAVAVGLVPATP